MSVGLVVDDDPGIRRLFAEVFRRGGHRVVEARSGREALRLVHSAVPDFVVTDIEMAEIDGLELCRQLRRLHPTMVVPIIVVTGAAATQADEATAAGCDVVLPKPCSPVLLLATVQRLLLKSPAFVRGLNAPAE